MPAFEEKLRAALVDDLDRGRQELLTMALPRFKAGALDFMRASTELVGNGIVLALTLIKNLEVNEQVLYARMIDVEETSLILGAPVATGRRRW